MDIDNKEVNKFLKDLKEFYQDLGEKTSRVHVLEGLYLIQTTKELIIDQQSKIDKLKSGLLEMAKVTYALSIENRSQQTYGNYQFCVSCSQHNMYDSAVEINHSKNCKALKAESIIKASK